MSAINPVKTTAPAKAHSETIDARSRELEDAGFSEHTIKFLKRIFPDLKVAPLLGSKPGDTFQEVVANACESARILERPIIFERPRAGLLIVQPGMTYLEVEEQFFVNLRETGKHERRQPDEIEQEAQQFRSKFERENQELDEAKRTWKLLPSFLRNWIYEVTEKELPLIEAVGWAAAAKKVADKSGNLEGIEVLLQLENISFHSLCSSLTDKYGVNPPPSPESAKGIPRLARDYLRSCSEPKY